jgi:hypothetical protein
MTAVNRRQFLRAAGVALALPTLESIGAPAAAGPTQSVGVSAAGAPRRMLFVNTSLGLYGPNLFPTQAGRNYESTPYLDVIKAFRDDYTIFSGVSHPEVDGGHSSEASFLTAAPHPGSSSFRNTISVDQLAAEQLGATTRFPYLALATARQSLSVNRSGIRIPSESRPSQVFRKLFMNGTPQEVAREVERLKDGRSLLDTVRGQAKMLSGQVSAADRDRLDQYFTAVREVEQRLVGAEDWSNRPKPKVDVKPPNDIADRTDIIGRTRLMFDVIHLAFQTDSTRIVTLSIDGMNDVPPIKGVTIDHHNLSHHGKDPQKLAQLKIVETLEMEAFRDLLTRLKDVKETGGTLLDHTAIFYGSNLGNAASHDTRNMPVILAGGGFRHGQHLAFDSANNAPLPRVFVSMLQRFGIEVDTFASGKGRMTGLEFA